MRRSINILRYYAGEGVRMPGRAAPSPRERVKASSFRSKEQGLSAPEFYSDFKTVYLKY